MPLSIWYCHLPPDSSPEIFTVAKVVNVSAVPEPVSETNAKVVVLVTVKLAMVVVARVDAPLTFKVPLII